MKTIRIHSRVALFVSAIMLVLPISPVMAGAGGDKNAPVNISFTKWVTTFPHMEGITGGDVDGVYVGEVLQRQVSSNPNLNSIIRLEAIYEVHDVNGVRSFTALIRGGTDGVTGAALLDGVILAGWRTGAPVHVKFETIPAATGCVGAPLATTCFEGTIHVGRVPTRKN
jgi:hypothetical protein